MKGRGRERKRRVKTRSDDNVLCFCPHDCVFRARLLNSARLMAMNREIKTMNSEKAATIQGVSTDLRELLSDEDRVAKILSEDRRKQDFIGRFLPFTLSDDASCDPVRYELGDEWLDLLVVYDPDWGWEVQVLERSSEDVNLSDVYADLQKRLIADFANQCRAPNTKPMSSEVLADVVSRLERLERKASRPVEIPTIETPYLNAEESAAYLRLETVKALYGLVERRRLIPLRGPRRRIRFTKDMLDQYMQREGAKR